MADTTVDTTLDGATETSHSCWGPYWSDISTGVIIFRTTNDDVRSARTTDKGATWTIGTINAGTMRFMSAWYDQETPGDTGTLVHVLWMDAAGTDATFYRTIDVSDGTLGTERTVHTAAVDDDGTLNALGITKTRNGNLLVAIYADTSPILECYRSTDSGANWTDRADVMESDNDHVRLFPANTGDDADAAAIFWDKSANEISVKMYDDSANSWTETSIDSDAVIDVRDANMDGIIRHSDSHLLIAFHSDADTTGDDLRTYDLTVDSIASPTVTSKTNIFTNQAESAQVALFINQQDDEVRLAYLKGGTWQATVDLVFHISTDGMGVWGSEQAYSEAAADDLRLLHAGRSVGDDGGRYQPTFFNDDLLDLFVNEVNDVEIAAVAAVSQPGYAREKKINRGIILRLVMTIGILLGRGAS